MTTRIYQVIGWDEHFEGAKSRTYNHKTTCQMPTKRGLGYKRLIRQPDGAAMFGAWCALIETLSTHAAPRQGYCTDTGRIPGRPYTPEDLELLTDIPAGVFTGMLEVAASAEVGWLTVTEQIPHGHHADTTRIPQYPLNSDSDLDLDSNSDSDQCAQLASSILTIVNSNTRGRKLGVSALTQLEAELPAMIAGGETADTILAEFEWWGQNAGREFVPKIRTVEDIVAKFGMIPDARERLARAKPQQMTAAEVFDV